MTHHTRIRPFNTKDTYPEQNLDNDLCQAVVANGVVYIRGQIGQDLDTRENVGIGDVEAQADKAMANIKLLVEEAGGGLEDIVKVVVYLVQGGNAATFYAAIAAVAWFSVIPAFAWIYVQIETSLENAKASNRTAK